MNLLNQCIKKQRIEKKLNEFQQANTEEEFLPTNGYEYVYTTYKVYSPKVVKMLFELQDFIEKRLITYDYELLVVLKYNKIANRKYIKLIEKYIELFQQPFVEALKASVLDTAKKIQFCKLSAFQQKNLVQFDEFYKSCVKDLK